MLALASQLAQLRPADVIANLAYSASIQTEITRIVICNTVGTAQTFSIYHDDNGTTYNDDTALYKDSPIAANETLTVQLQNDGGGISVAAGGSIAVQSNLAGALNFTLYGITTRITG